MKKIISILLSLVLTFCAAVTVFATDAGDIDFGELAGVAGDVNVDTKISSADLVSLGTVFLGVNAVQSKKTADVNKDGDVDIRDLVALKKILSDIEKLYYAEGITTVCGDESDKTTWMYKVNGSGLYVREADINFGDGNNVIEIVQLSDFHLISALDENSEDEVIKTTYANRKTSFTSPQHTQDNAKRALEFADFYDETIITGDVIDYLSINNLNVLKEIIGESGATAVVGNHEFRKVWYGNYELDETIPEAERYATLQENWPYNNIYYHSKVVKDKVMCITMNNGAGSNFEKYYAETFTACLSDGTEMKGTMDAFLAADIERAKKDGYCVLIFQHTPINTGDPNDRSVAQITNTGKPYNFTSFVGSDSEGVDGAVYNLITSNAGVIKGVFNGHTHGQYYTEINAKNSQTDTEYNTVIPQYTLTCNAYNSGSALKITVKY